MVSMTICDVEGAHWRSRRDERPVLARNRNRNQRWTIRPESGAERLLDFLLCLRQCASAAETLRGGDHVEAGKIESGDIGSLLENSEFLEDGVFAVTRHDEDDLCLVLYR